MDSSINTLNFVSKQLLAELLEGYKNVTNVQTNRECEYRGLSYHCAIGMVGGAYQ